MARGKIDPPNLDDRTWQDLVNQAKALIPHYAPEWTDHNPSDLGITLVELFAWLVEQMIYRLNRVPEKNYVAFLNLLGITRDPAVPASVFLTYQTHAEQVIVPKGTRASTRQIGAEEAIIFETDEDVEILPMNLVCALKISRSGGAYTCADMTAQFVTLTETDSAKKTFAIPARQSVMLALGFDKTVDTTKPPIRLRFWFRKPLGNPLYTFGLTERGLSSLFEYGKSMDALVNERESLDDKQKEEHRKLRKTYNEVRTALARGGFLFRGRHIVYKMVTEWRIDPQSPLPAPNPYILHRVGNEWELRRESPVATMTSFRKILTDVPEEIENSLALAVNGETEGLGEMLEDNDITINIASVEPVREFWRISDGKTAPIYIPMGSSVLFGRTNLVEIAWCYSSEEKSPFDWPTCTNSDDTDGLQRDGVVSLPVPLKWAAQASKTWCNENSSAVSGKERFWVGVKITNNGEETVSFSPEYILFNSVSATNALTIKEEYLGASDGRPLQQFELAHRPLFKQPDSSEPYQHLTVKVTQGKKTEEEQTEEWSYCETLPAGGGQHYRLNPVTGSIYFGNYNQDTGNSAAVLHGTIPPHGSKIYADYRYVAGGRKGNVPANSVTIQYTLTTGIVSVTNLLAATGGEDEESVDSAKRRAPALLKNRFRAVTLQDYEYLAREASTRVAKVCALPPLEAKEGEAQVSGGLNREIGSVNVLIIPTLTAENPLAEPRPLPADDLLHEVGDYLEERRTLSTRLHVGWPRYLPITVSATIKVWPEALPLELEAGNVFKQKLKSDFETRVKAFLHPLTGGPEKQGWEFGQQLLLSDLLKAVQLEPKVAYIEKILAKAEDPEHARPEYIKDNSSYYVQVADFEIICSSDAHNITVEQQQNNQ
jgi:hypothetical protein